MRFGLKKLVNPDLTRHVHRLVAPSLLGLELRIESCYVEPFRAATKFGRDTSMRKPLIQIPCHPSMVQLYGSHCRNNVRLSKLPSEET